MAGEGVNVGEIFGRLGFRVDQSGSQQWDRTRQKAETDARKPIVQQLGFQVDDRALGDYRRKLDEIKARNARRDDFKAKLGADYDPRAFRAYERDVAKAEREAQRLTATTSQQSRSFDTNRASVEGAAKAFRSLFDQAAKITALGIAAQGLSALGAGAGAAASGLAPLSGLLAAYPALASAGAQGLGVFKLATDNVFQAVGGLNQQLDKNSKAFKELDPQAKQLAQRLEDMKQPLRDLSKEAQGGLFPGVVDGIQSLDRLMPTVRTIVADTAKALGGLAREAGSLLASWGPDLETQGARNVRWIKEGGGAALALADALRHVVLAAGPLTDWIVRQSTAFAHLIDRQAEAGRKSGELAGFFEQTRVQMSRIVRIAADVGTALFNIGKQAYPLGNDLLKSLTKNADKFREWTESAKGRNVIADYFDRARPAIYELSKLIKDVTTTFFQLGSGDQVAPLLQTVRTQLLPAFARLVDSTTRAFGPAFLDALTQALVLFSNLGGSSGPLVAFTKMLGEALKLLNGLIDQFPVLGTAIASLAALGGIAKALNIAVALTGIKSLIGLIRTTRREVAVTEATTATQGRGKGGGVLGSLPIIGALLATLGPKVRSQIGPNPDAASVSSVEKQIDGIVRAAKNVPDAVAKIRSLGDWFNHVANLPGKPDAWQRYYGEIADAANRAATQLQNSGRNMGETLDVMKTRFRGVRDFTTGRLEDIRAAVRDNMRVIKVRMDVDSDAGRKAISQNFRLASRAIRAQMDNGKIATKDGMAAIRGYLAAELQLYGIDMKTARRVARQGGTENDSFYLAGHGTPPTPGANRATGGMASPYGGGGGDDHILIDPAGRPVAAMSGTEGVINRPQMAIIDRALAITQTLGLGQFGGLGELWGSGMRHYATGGRFPGVSGDTDFAPALGNALSAMARAAGQGIFVQSGRRTVAEQLAQGPSTPGHPVAGPNGPHVRGVAADITPGFSVFGALARRFGLGFTVMPQEPWHVQLLGAAAGAGAAMAARIPGVTVRGGGSVGRAAQAAIGIARGGAQSLLDRAAATSAFGGDGAGGAVTAAGGLSKAQLAGLWRRAGGPGNVAPLMAAIALAESGGNPRAHNPSGATGLWQILGNPFPGNAYDPFTNARMAVAKYRTQGLGAWEAYTNGNYRGFLKRGGLVRRFNGGGPLNTASGAGDTSHSGTAQGFPIRAARRHARHRIGEYESTMGLVETLRKDYALQERQYNRIDDGDILNDKGEFNQALLTEKTEHLFVMLTKAEQITKWLRHARKLARRVANNYREIVKRLRNSLRHARNKDRSGIRTRLADARGELTTWEGTAGDLRYDVENAKLDFGDLGKEWKALDPRARVSADSGAADPGDVAGGGGLTADQQAQLDQTARLREIVATGNFLNTAALQTLGVFDPNRVGEAGYGGAPPPVGSAAGGTRSAMTLSDGTEVPAGGVVHLTQLTVNTLHPGDPQTLMAIAGAANAGNSYRGGVPSPRKVLGV